MKTRELADLTHPLTIHYCYVACPACVCVWLAVFNCLLHLPWFGQVSAWRFHCLKSTTNSEQPQLLFPSTSKSKICPVYSSLCLTCLNQHSLLHLNTEPRRFSFNQLRREFVLIHSSFLILHRDNSIAVPLCSKRFLSSCSRVQQSDESRIVPLTQLLYTWSCMFKEIA